MQEERCFHLWHLFLPLSLTKGLRRPRKQLDRSVEISSRSSAITPIPTPEVEEEIVQEEILEEEVVEDEPQPVDLPSAPDLDDAEVIGTEVEAEQEDVFAERLGREGAASGEVQVSLIWFNKNDLDLSVVCPSGERISFDNKISNCGGRLDIDMNETGNSEEPVENVFWEKDAPKGRYRVFVEHFEKHDSTDVTEFNILVSVEGNPREFKGQISSGDPPQEVCFFDVE